MRVVVTLLGYLRLELGRKEAEIDLPEGASVAEAVARLVETLGSPAEPVLLSPRNGFNVLFSINGQAAKPSAILIDGDRIALFPPSAGGGAGAGDCSELLAARGEVVPGLTTPWLTFHLSTSNEIVPRM